MIIIGIILMEILIVLPDWLVSLKVADFCYAEVFHHVWYNNNDLYSIAVS